MDKLAQHPKLTTFTFHVKGVKFEIAAKNQCDAFQAANCKLWSDMADVVPAGTNFAWFDGVQPNTFHWQDNVFLD